jgi:hypothetical protein
MSVDGAGSTNASSTLFGERTSWTKFIGQCTLAIDVVNGWCAIDTGVDTPGDAYSSGSLGTKHSRSIAADAICGV